jgi:HEPN domain-containing protein
VNRRDFQELAIVRLAKARVLIAASRWDGACYLCGYSVECGLKACIAKLTRRHDFPDREVVRQSCTHDLTVLVRAAGLEPSLTTERTSPAFNTRWNLVKDWSEASRYLRIIEPDARGLLDAVANRRHGVLRWIRRHW